MLRGDKRTAPIPVVILTVCNDAAERQRLKALGAAGVIAKPFDPLTPAAEGRRFVAVDGLLSPAREGFSPVARSRRQRSFGLPAAIDAETVRGSLGRRAKSSCRAGKVDRGGMRR
jgi:DNA-binding NarL/FixJ family response regulator